MLKAWCTEAGYLIKSEVDPDRKGGREHDVTFIEKAKRWLKFTKWDCAGYTVDLEVGEPIFLPASPDQYLQRLRLQNSVFGDQIAFVGLQQRGHQLRILTEQPDIVGEAPSYDEMDRLLREKEDFLRLDIPPMGHYRSRSYIRGNLGLFDAHPANCVISATGDLIPIDFILLELADEDRRALMKRAV